VKRPSASGDADTSAAIIFVMLFGLTRGESCAGALIVDDGAFCQQLLAVLNQNIGRAIAEIGALDLSYTF